MTKRGGDMPERAQEGTKKEGIGQGNRGTLSKRKREREDGIGCVPPIRKCGHSREKKGKSL